MEIIVRATIVYTLVFVLIRAMGKRELSEMSAFELVLLVMIGDMVQQGVTGEDYSIAGALLAVATLVFWVVTTSVVTYRFTGTRDLLEGNAVIVIHDGRIQHQALKTERISVEELVDAVRQQGIDDLRRVRFGVLEGSGRFSFVTSTGPGPRAEDQERRAE
jgi:uncharacterized membrane protein YcaP (DUF421 family)